MKKIQIALILLITAAGIGAFFLESNPFVITTHQNARISLAPFGYSYNNKAFTGLLYSFHRNNKLKRISFLYQGKLHFKDIHWYSNGQKQLLLNYWNGVIDGYKKVWYHTGEARAISYYESGKRHGEAWGWYPDGQTREFTFHDSGREVVIRSFTNNNKPFHNWVRSDYGKKGIQGDRNCDKNLYGRR